MSKLISKPTSKFSLFKAAGALALLSASSFLHAKVIQVLPGHNTLSAAISQTDNGDTVVLVDGYYTDDAQLNISNSITLRSISPDVTPVLSGVDIQVHSSGAYFVMQGLRYTQRYYSSFYRGCNLSLASTTVRVVNNSFSTGCYVSVAASTNVGEKVLAGNTSTNTRFQLGQRVTFVANSVYGAGTNARGTGAGYLVSVGNHSYVVGNFIKCEIVDTDAKNCNFLNSSSYSYIVANRLEQSLSGIFSLDTETYTAISAATHAQVHSNLIHYNNSENYFTGAKQIKPITVNGVVNVTNNLIYVSGDMPSTKEASNAIYVDAGSVGRVQNNMVVNFPNNALKTDSIEVEFVYNLCFNNGDNSACDTNKGNLVADPKFVDTTDFVLASDSPAIDAGDPALHLSDIDGTRADIGLHGGRYGFSQYDDQRDASDKPYIYPLFGEVNLTNIDEVVAKAISIARFK